MVGSPSSLSWFSNAAICSEECNVIIMNISYINAGLLTKSLSATMLFSVEYIIFL